MSWKDSLCLHNTLEVPEQPKPCGLIRDGQEGSRDVAAEHESCKGSLREPKGRARNNDCEASLMPLASREIVARSEIGTCLHPSSVSTSVRSRSPTGSSTTNLRPSQL